MKIMTIVGARPQFIKTAVVSRALRATEGIREILVHTGQHYDAQMSAIFFDELEIPAPEYNLGIGSGAHGAQTGRMLEALEEVMVQERPELVLVFGDTNSTMAGALAAAKLHIPIAHVESGLRSYNRRMPEEINRVITDHVADILFAPTPAAVENLGTEGISGERVQLVGDVTFDAAMYYGERAEQKSTILAQLALTQRDYALATVHRQENTDDPERLRTLFLGLEALAAETPTIVALHPRTRAALTQIGLPATTFAHLRLIDPLGYLDMVRLVKSAGLIVTDSGGVQKEAFYYHVPCVVLREESEYTELVTYHFVHPFLPETPEALPRFCRQVLGRTPETMPVGVFGDGQAALHITTYLAKWLRNAQTRAEEDRASYVR